MLNSDKSSARPLIFSYNSLNSFFKDYISYLKKVKKLSYRSISAKCKINSPGYIQKVLDNKRSITSDFLRKFIQGFIESSLEAEYLQALFFYEKTSDINKKNSMLDALLRISKKALIKEIDDKSLFNHWIYGVILEMVNIKKYNSPHAIKENLKNIVDQKTISNAINFLLQKQYLREENGKIRLAEPFIVKVSNDQKRILEIQHNHAFFLNLARFHLIDNLDEREYQGLTLAINKDKLPLIKKLIRNNVLEIREKFADDPSANSVYRVQISAFKIC